MCVQKCSPSSLPHVQTAGAICSPACGCGKAQRSHTAQSHTSSPRAHRSQPDRWTLMAAWTVFEMACLKFDGTKSQQHLILIIWWLLCFCPVMMLCESPYSLPSCLREPLLGSPCPLPTPCLLALAAGKVYPPADWTCGPHRPQALR